MIIKQFFFLMILFLGLSINAQRNDFEKNNITELELKIKQSVNAEHLKWLDSLTVLVEFDEALKYDSIAGETIKFALRLDSLDVAAKNTNKLIHYHNNILGNSVKALQIFKDFLSTIKKANSNAIKSRFYLYGADCYAGIVNFNTALEYYKQAKYWALKASNQSLLGTIALKTGGVLMEMGEAVDASKHIQEAIRIFTKEKDTLNLINAKSDISILYSQNAFYKEAKKERDEAIALSNVFKQETAVSLLYYNAAADYRLVDNQKKRLSNLRLALKHNNSEFRRFYEPFFLCDLTIALAENDSIKKAEQYFNKIKNDPDTYSEGIQKEMYIEVLKQMALCKKQFNKAIKYGEQHLALKKKHKGYVEIMNAEKFLSNVYKKTNDDRNQEKHLINYYKIKDSISKVQNVKTLTYYQTLYETEKRDLKIRAQESNIALLDEKNKVKNQWLLFGGIGLVAFFGFIMLYRSRNTAKQKQFLQEQFSQDLIKTQEEERTRVARELHDSVGQKLMLLSKKTKSSGDNDLELLAGNTLEELRSISRGLHPATIERLGVTAAIISMINEVDKNTNIFFTSEIENIDTKLSKDTALHLYRIIQEALNNMVKHAEAKAAFINIESNQGEIKTTIKDNGKGFDYFKASKNHRSLGMKTLMERAKIIKSKLQIKTQPNKGTTVELIMPIS